MKKEVGNRGEFRENIFVLIFITGILFSLNFVFASIVVLTPANSTNYSSSGLFNVSFANATDITIGGSIGQTTINASFYYNLSGSWVLIGNSSACAVNACWGVLDTSGLTAGVYSINATLINASTTAHFSSSCLFPFPNFLFLLIPFGILSHAA